MSKDITDELIIREDTSGYSFEKSGVTMEQDINNLIEELTKVRPDELSKEGLKLFNKINEIIDKNKELEEFKKQVTEIENTNFIKYKNYIQKSLVEEKIEEYFEDEEWLVEHDLRALCDDEKECREYYTNKKIALKDIKKVILDKLNKLLKNY